MTKSWRIFFLGLVIPLFASAEPPVIQATPVSAIASPTATAPAPEPAPAPATPAPGAAETPTPTVTEAPPIAPMPAIKNMASVAKALQLKKFKDRKFTRKIKIAILDNGFSGWEAEVGKTIPADVKYHAGAESKADERKDVSLHGLFMAQLVAAVIKESGAEADYEMHLFNSYGYKKLKSATEEVVRDKFDLVLYSQVWDYGGNGDGKGFINALVDPVVKAGITWINAAGNFGYLTKLAPIEGKKEDDGTYAIFRNKKGKEIDGVTLQCKVMKEGEQCPLKVFLTWNDFKDDPDTGTDKDLDFVLLDSKNKVLFTSDFKQMLTLDADPKASRVPRELIETGIGPGTYKLRVKIKSDNFSKDKDVLRITAAGKGIEMADASIGETLLAPADNAGVIVVGAADDFQTSTSKTMERPHLYVKSLIKLDNGLEPFASSNAAALVAGLAVLNIGIDVQNTNEALLEALKPISVLKPMTAPPSAPPAQAQGGKGRGQGQYADYDVYRRRPYTGEPMPGQQRQRSAPAQEQPQQNCVRRVRLPNVYPALQNLLDQGGAEAVLIRKQAMILINYNYACYQGLCPQPGQRLVVGPQGLVLASEQDLAYGLPQDYYQVVMRDIPVCN